MELLLPMINFDVSILFQSLLCKNHICTRFLSDTLPKSSSIILHGYELMLAFNFFVFNHHRSHKIHGYILTPILRFVSFPPIGLQKASKVKMVSTFSGNYPPGFYSCYADAFCGFICMLLSLIT